MQIAYRCMQWLGRVVVVIGLLNCVAFFVIAVWIGGVAVNKKNVAGHYQVVTGARHISYMEVSHEMWSYSRAHMLSVIATAPIILAGGLLSTLAGKRVRRRDRAR
jgi:fucose 4-O-acetylase-like acetyltransferase